MLAAMNASQMPDTPGADSLKDAAPASPPGLLRELVEFLVREKKWWLLPIVAALLLMGILAAAMHSPLAPVIYPLF